MDLSRTLELAGIIAAWIVGLVVLGTIKLLMPCLGRFIQRLFLPLESRLLRLLQERAMARALGVDIEVIRARRRIETGH